MPTSSGNSTVIQVLDEVLTQFNRYGAIVIFLFGVTGNVLNILVLSQRSFRSNSCAWIFLVSSIVNLISILSGLIAVMVSGWTTNPTNYLGWVCKLRADFVFTTRTIGPWLIVLATVDRWLLSSISAARRQLSSLKNAQRWAFIIILLSIILYSQMLYCYEANLTDTPLKCYGKTAACRLVTDVSFAVMTIFLPLIFMILFGLLTVSNVHQSQRRILALSSNSTNPVAGNKPSSHTLTTDARSKLRTDRSLLRMLLAQVLLLALFTLPLSLDKFYSSFSGDSGDATEQAINSFVYNMSILMYFVSNGIPFYAYTLCGGTVFRKALYSFLLMAKQKFIHLYRH